MMSNLVPLTSAQAEHLSLPFPSDCPVYVYDAKDPDCSIIQGTVTGSLLQYSHSPSVTIFSKVLTLGEQPEQIVKESRNLRYRNGCPVFMKCKKYGDSGNSVEAGRKNMEGIILGICDIPQRLRENKEDSFWYSIELCHKEGRDSILHEVNPSDVSFRRKPVCRPKLEDDGVPDVIEILDAPVKIESDERDWSVPQNESCHLQKKPGKASALLKVSREKGLQESSRPKAKNEMENSGGNCQPLISDKEHNLKCKTKSISACGASQQNPIKFLQSEQKHSANPEYIERKISHANSCKIVETSNVSERTSVPERRRSTAREESIFARHSEKRRRLSNDSDRYNLLASDGPPDSGSHRRSYRDDKGGYSKIESSRKSSNSGRLVPFRDSCRHEAPSPHENRRKSINGREYFWCGKCRGGLGYWTDHLEDEHDSFKRHRSSNGTSRPSLRNPGNVEASRRERSSAKRLTNRGYDRRMFEQIYEQAHSIKFLKGQKGVPISQDNKTPMCISYHVGGSCSQGCIKSHIQPSREKLEELVSWCNDNLRQNKCLDDKIIGDHRSVNSRNRQSRNKSLHTCRIKNLSVLQYESAWSILIGPKGSAHRAIKKMTKCNVHYEERQGGPVCVKIQNFDSKTAEDGAKYVLKLLRDFHKSSLSEVSIEIDFT